MLRLPSKGAGQPPAPCFTTQRRLADEYDAAQERGELAGQGKPSQAEGLATAADAGLTHKEIHEARKKRDAEEREPGIVRRALDEVLRERKEAAS